MVPKVAGSRPARHPRIYILRIFCIFAIRTISEEAKHTIVVKFSKIRTGECYIVLFFSGCSSVGRAPGLGPGGRTFESCHPDKEIYSSFLKTTNF